MKDKINLGNVLRNIRLLRRQSQSEFAKEICVARSTVQSIERGKLPSLDTICCIAEKLDVPVVTLLTGETDSSVNRKAWELVCRSEWFAGLEAEEQERFLQLLQEWMDFLARLQKGRGNEKSQ